MNVLRKFVCLCLLLALPLQFAAAQAPCCPAVPATHGAAQPVHPANHRHAAAHRHHGASLAHAGHPCERDADGAAQDERTDTPCKDGRCASHCAHVQVSLAALRPQHPAPSANPAPAAADAAARADAPSPLPLRPPIATPR